eukprot:gene32420-43314_t
MIIIGDEILNGFTTDLNLQVATKALSSIGVPLKKVSIVSDDVNDIVEEIRRLSQKYDIVITSGGIGPTHDDVTLKAVALALGQGMAPNADMLKHLGEVYSIDPNSSSNSKNPEEDAKLLEIKRLAYLPEISRLHFAPSPDDYHYYTTAEGVTVRARTWPILQCENIFVLPGVPKFFAAKMELIVKYFMQKYSPLETRKIVLAVEERRVVRMLDALVAKHHPAVKVGAYPFVDHPDFKTIITVQASESSQVDAAVAELLEMMPRGYVLRVETGLHSNENLL